MRLQLFLRDPRLRQVIKMHKQITPNTINNNKPILTIIIIKFQSPSIPIILKQFMRLRVSVCLLLRLLIIRIILVSLDHLLMMHVIVSVFWWVVLSHLISRVHAVWVVMIVARYLSRLLLMNYVISCWYAFSILRTIFICWFFLLFF